MTAVAEHLVRMAALPGVDEAVEAAREACTGLLRHRGLRRRADEMRAEAVVRAGSASAALEGARVPMAVVREAVRGGALPADAAGRLVGGVLRALAVIDGGGAAPPAPAQLLARLHLAATAGSSPVALVGRPRPPGRLPEDGIGDPATAPAGPALAGRLAGVAQLLTAPSAVPALVVAALVHAEVITARPFVTGNGVVARAAARAVIVGRGLDRTGVAVWETGHLDAGPGYVAALRAYAGGTPSGVAAWLVHCAAAVVAGAAEGRAIGDAVMAGRLPTG